MQKLCTALITLFLRPTVTWAACLRHLIYSFLAGSNIPESDLPDTATLSDALILLKQHQLVSVLTLSSTLAEEASKLDSDSQHRQVDG